jgi:hypothetical protein
VHCRQGRQQRASSRSLPTCSALRRAASAAAASSVLHITQGPSQRPGTTPQRCPARHRLCSEKALRSAGAGGCGESQHKLLWTHPKEDRKRMLRVIAEARRSPAGVSQNSSSSAAKLAGGAGSAPSATSASGHRQPAPSRCRSRACARIIWPLHSHRGDGSARGSTGLAPGNEEAVADAAALACAACSPSPRRCAAGPSPRLCP